MLVGSPFPALTDQWPSIPDAFPRPLRQPGGLHPGLGSLQIHHRGPPGRCPAQEITRAGSAPVPTCSAARAARLRSTMPTVRNGCGACEGPRRHKPDWAAPPSGRKAPAAATGKAHSHHLPDRVERRGAVVQADLGPGILADQPHLLVQFVAGFQRQDRLAPQTVAGDGGPARPADDRLAATRQQRLATKVRATSISWPRTGKGHETTGRASRHRGREQSVGRGPLRGH